MKKPKPVKPPKPATSAKTVDTSKMTPAEYAAFCDKLQRKTR